MTATALIIVECQGDETEEWFVSGPNDNWDDGAYDTREEAMEDAEDRAFCTGAVIRAET